MYALLLLLLLLLPLQSLKMTKHSGTFVTKFGAKMESPPCSKIALSAGSPVISF